MVDSQEFKKFISSQLPAEIMEFIIKGFINIYGESYDSVFEKYQREQAIDHLPYRRIPEIESFLQLLPNRFPIAKANCYLNNSLNSHHVEITINQIVFTQSFCKSSKDKIRDAEFRNSLSKFNIQEKFNFGENDILEISNKDKYYAVLRHGAQGREPKMPEFFDLFFPSESKENYIEPIDILKLYGLSLTSLQPDIEAIKSKEALDNPTLKSPKQTEERIEN